MRASRLAFAEVHRVGVLETFIRPTDGNKRHDHLFAVGAEVVRDLERPAPGGESCYGDQVRGAS